MKYKVMINGQAYKVSMSDEADYIPKDDKDIIIYTIDEDNQVIHARIENPSQHTLYLISQGRCRITINCRTFRGHGPVGNHMKEWGVPGGEHSSGLGRGSYRFHKHWSPCLDSSSLLNANEPIKVTNINDIEIPYHYQISKYWAQWAQQYYYRSANIHGYSSLERYSDDYEHPYRDEFYFDIRLALSSDQSPQFVINNNWTWSSHHRIYQTKSKITRLTFTKE